ncbi:MAG: hypothetical protein IH886_08335 [Nitrospinae bacterium]|nr:hypothetical protein [Nitrospinota bacterium]
MKAKRKVKKKTVKSATKPAEPGVSQEFAVILDSGTHGKTYADPDLLCVWMAKKLNDHSKPQRKGTPEGEPISFGNKKYLAVLFSLIGNSVKHTAKLVDVSYGVLRKWRTEGEFINQMNMHRGEFSEFYIHHSIQFYADNCVPANLPLKASLEMGLQAVNKYKQGMASAHLYSNGLKDEISWQANSAFENKTKTAKAWWKMWGFPDPTFLQRASFFSLVVGYIDPKFKARSIEAQKPMFKRVLVQIIKRHLENKKEKGGNREDALIALELLENIIR